MTSGQLIELGPAILLVTVTLVLAGIVKGGIGFGLPLVAVSLLSNVVRIELALALMTLPIVASNLWLGVQGGQFWATLRRFWPVVAAVGIGIFAGSGLLVGMDRQRLLLVLGLLIIGFSLIEQLNPGRRVRIPDRLIRPYGIAAGIAGGVMGGLSTAYGPPLIVYLTALRLPKELFVQTIGVIWFFASIFLVIAFARVQVLTAHTALLSGLSIVPVFLGLHVGRWLRGRANQRVFQRATLVALMVLGVNLIRRALF